MATMLFLPDPDLLELIDVEMNDHLKLITAMARSKVVEAACPLCHQASTRVHSRYTRTLADLPCLGQEVQWVVQVRRFRCLNASCRRKIFAERLPTCALPYGRRTLRQTKALSEMACELGGRVGERIACLLSMTISDDTLLRLVRRSQSSVPDTPRVLGVDDFGATRSYMSSRKDSRKEALTWSSASSALPG